MRFQRIHEAVHFRPWFISTSGYESVRALLSKAMDGKMPTKQAGDDDDWMSNFVRVRPEMEVDGNGIAKIYIFGVLGLHLTGIEKTCGNTDYGDVQREISQAIGQGARGILFVIDSPGGMVTGCDECARAISECQIPTVAFTDTMVCSAAYYVAAGVDSIVASQSSELGNVGIIMPWVDTSKMLELMGVRPEPIVNEGATLKSIGREGSLSDEQRQFLQDTANQSAGRFQGHIAAHRVVDEEIWKAGWYSGEMAESLGLIDFIGDESTAYGVLLSKIPLE
jgi:ClpP class serine protease